MGFGTFTIVYNSIIRERIKRGVLIWKQPLSTIAYPQVS